jgi:hypothetical protein
MNLAAIAKRHYAINKKYYQLPILIDKSSKYRLSPE